MTETLEKLIKIFKKSLKEKNFLGREEEEEYLKKRIKEYEDIINNVKNLKKG